MKRTPKHARRFLCALMAALLSCTLLVATGCQDDASSSNPSDSSDKGDIIHQIPGYTDRTVDYKNEEFRIMVYGSGDKPEAGSDKEALHNLVASRNNISSIVWDTVADWNAFQSKLTSEVLAGDAADIVMMPMYWYFPSVTNYLLHEIPDAQSLVDASPLWIDKVSLGYMDTGRYYALLDDSYIANTEGICYNKDILAQYNLEDPAKLYVEGKWDWDTFFTYMETVSKDTDGDGYIDVYGYGCPGLMDGRADVVNFIASNGGEMLRQEGNRFVLGLNESRGLEALEFIKKCGFDNSYMYVELNMNFTTAMNMWSTGNIAMLGMCAWGIGEAYVKDFSAGFVGYPVGPNAGEDYSIWNTSPVMISSPATTASPVDALAVYEQIRLCNYALNWLDQDGSSLDSDIVASVEGQLGAEDANGKLALTEDALSSWVGADPDEYSLPAIHKAIENQKFSPLEGVNDFRHYGKSVITDILYGLNTPKGTLETLDPDWQAQVDDMLNTPLEKFLANPDGTPTAETTAPETEE